MYLYSAIIEWWQINIKIILTTEEVSKLDKSTEVKEVHEENKYDIDVTFEVFKLLKFTDVKDVHSEKIFSILITDEVSK